MPAQIVTASSPDYSGARGVGNFRPIAPGTAGTLFAEYAFGTKRKRRTGLEDLSNHNHNLTVVGSPTYGLRYALCEHSDNASNGFECPFTTSQVAAVTGKITLIVLARALSGTAGWFGIGGYDDAVGTEFIHHCARTPSGGAAFTYHAVGSPTPLSRSAVIGYDAHYGTGFEVSASTYTNTGGMLYLRYPGVALKQAAIAAGVVAAPAGSRRMRIGCAHGAASTNFDDPVQIAYVAVHADALTPTQITSCWNQINAEFAPDGIYVI